VTFRGCERQYGEEVRPAMMRTARFVVTFVFVFCSAVQLVAQTKPSADSSQKTGDQEARIQRVVATLVD
jgi:hypothetical protein